MTKFRFRFLNALLITILVGFIGIALLLGNIFKGLFLSELKEQLKHEYVVVQAFLQEGEWDQSNLASLQNRLPSRLDGTYVVYLKDGTIVNLTERSESNEVSFDVLNHFAQDIQPLEKGDQLSYYIPFSFQGERAYLSFETEPELIQNGYHKRWIVIFTSLTISFIIIVMISLRIMHRLTMPLEDTTRVANELARGNFKARTYDFQLDETGQLSQSINVLARNLEEMTKSYEVQQDRLMTIIENMGSSLILLDKKGYSVLINRACKELFALHENDWRGLLYYDAFQEHQDVVRVIEETFMTEQKVRKSALVSFEIERKHLDVESTPIIDVKDRLKGIVVVLNDITELKKLEQMRKDFVANVSHELKTPITSIKGFSETLLDGAMNEKELREQFLSIILKESGRLESLIQDLLDLSHIEKEHFSLYIQTVSLSHLLDESIMLLQSKAEEKGITFHVDVHGETSVQADQNRIKQIFINLMNNGITYTEDGGAIYLSLEEKDDHVLFSIRDTGVGMKKEEIPRIFERFYRVDRARSRQSGGTGLGLAIVKHLVEAHEGEISVESEPGEGTTFYIDFKKQVEAT